MWKLKGAFIVNEKDGRVLDIQSGLDAENRNILVWKKHGKINQQWDIIYADEYPEEPKKGELNKDFGFKVDTDFHIESQLKSNRYLDVLGRNLVIKTRNGRKT